MEPAQIKFELQRSLNLRVKKIYDNGSPMYASIYETSSFGTSFSLEKPDQRDRAMPKPTINSSSKPTPSSATQSTISPIALIWQLGRRPRRSQIPLREDFERP
jgi:hypothetical protein